MKKSVVITDVTRMSNDRVCIAAVDSYGHSIRPEFPFGGIPESWLYQNNIPIIRPFSKVNLVLIENRPDPPHTEDWIIDPNEVEYVGMIDINDRLRFLKGILDPSVQEIFVSSVLRDNGFFVQTGTGARSLGTVEVEVLRFQHACFEGKWDYRLSFSDKKGAVYKLGVTDLSFRYFINWLRETNNMSCEDISTKISLQLRNHCVLRIGLARHWSKFPDRCYLQVNSVFSFPDLLDGKCYADFQPPMSR